VRITLAPEYHDVTLHPTVQGLELHCENASGDVWIIALNSATFELVAHMILASYGVFDRDSQHLAGTQEEIPF